MAKRQRGTDWVDNVDMCSIEAAADGVLTPKPKGKKVLLTKLADVVQ